MRSIHRDGVGIRTNRLHGSAWVAQEGFAIPLEADGVAEERLCNVA